MNDADLYQELEERLQRRWPGTSIASAEPLAGDASSRRYLRLHLAGGAAARSAIAMLTEGSGLAMSSDELGETSSAATPPFLDVARFLAAITDAVPEIYAHSDDGAQVLLEDVGDTSLFEACRANNPPAAAGFAAALHLLAHIQTAAAESPDPACVAFGRSFDETLFMWEFEHFLEFGVPGIGVESAAAAQAELAPLARRLDAYPKVFTHRDYHAWNLHVQGTRIRVFDFQDALMAPAMYDVASLLTDRSTPDLIDAELETRLIERFVQARGAGLEMDFDQALASYRLCAFQRALKVIGRFRYLANVKGKPGYLAFLPWTLATARRLAESIEGIDVVRGLLAGLEPAAA